MAQIGIPFNALKLYDSTIGYCSRSLELSERFNAEYKPVALEQLAEAYYAKGDFQKAFEFYKRFKITNDSVNNFDRRIATFINEKAEKEKQEIELRKNEVELRQNFTLLIGGIIALFLIAIAFITQNRYRVTRLLNAKLNESNATKDKLFAIISHDLKGPLSAFTELSNTLFRYGAMLSEEERSTTLTNMRRSSGNILRLLDNLLSWSRVQMKGYKIYPEPITLKYLVEEVLESLADLSAVKKMKLSSKIDEEIEIVADRNGLEMVVRNLVSNAIKYSEIGGEIAIVAKTVNGKTEISVRDEGVGVSEEMQKILFSSAPVKSKTGTKNEKGTGLGLVICKEIVELHGGEIRYEPNAGKGSVFTISM